MQRGARVDGFLDSPPFLGSFVVRPPGVPNVGSHGLLLVFGLRWRAFAAMALIGRRIAKKRDCAKNIVS